MEESQLVVGVRRRGRVIQYAVTSTRTCAKCLSRAGQPSILHLYLSRRKHILYTFGPSAIALRALPLIKDVTVLVSRVTITQ